MLNFDNGTFNILYIVQIFNYKYININSFNIVKHYF